MRSGFVLFISILAMTLSISHAQVESPWRQKMINLALKFIYHKSDCTLYTTIAEECLKEMSELERQLDQEQFKQPNLRANLHGWLSGLEERAKASKLGDRSFQKSCASHHTPARAKQGELELEYLKNASNCLNKIQTTRVKTIPERNLRRVSDGAREDLINATKSAADAASTQAPANR